MYTGFRPTVSDIGPAKSAPAPKPIRKRPVARDSVTLVTLKSLAAWGRAAESMLEAKPTIQPIVAMIILFRSECILWIRKRENEAYVAFNLIKNDQLCGFILS